MPRLVSSTHALRILVALNQRPEGFRTSEVAETIGATFSATQRALEVLGTDHLIVTEGSRVRPSTGPAAEAAVEFAFALLEALDIVSVVARANEVVEFAGADGQGVMVVVRRFAPLDGTVRCHAALQAIGRFHPKLAIAVLDKSEMRERLLTDLGFRTRARKMRVFAGSVDRSFPDRTRHGSSSLPSLGRLNPEFPHVSKAKLRALARRYRLSRIDAFGSAVRRDFRSDSDVDVLVTPRPSTHLGLTERVAFNYEIEGLLGRDVDVVTSLPARRVKSHHVEDVLVPLLD